jgi:hypothetical protein
MKKFLGWAAFIFVCAPIIVLQFLSPEPEQMAKPVISGIVSFMFAASWALALMMLHLRSKTVE